MLHRVVPEGRARRAGEHELRRQAQRLRELELQYYRQQQAEQTFVQNALVSAFVSHTGTEKQLVRPESVQMKITPSGKYVMTATIEVEVTPERWAEHFSPLLVPFSGVVTYNAHPAPKPPPPPCASPTPPSFGRGACELLLGHKGDHEHAGRTWNFTVRR